MTWHSNTDSDTIQQWPKEISLTWQKWNGFQIINSLYAYIGPWFSPCGRHIGPRVFCRHSTLVLPPRTCQLPLSLVLWCQSISFSVFPAFTLQCMPPSCMTCFSSQSTRCAQTVSAVLSSPWLMPFVQRRPTSEPVNAFFMTQSKKLRETTDKWSYKGNKNVLKIECCSDKKLYNCNF